MHPPSPPADIVLTEPGLSVIVSAVIGARCIFQRMTTYAKYTVAMTFRICFTFGLLTVIYNWWVGGSSGAWYCLCAPVRLSVVVCVLQLRLANPRACPAALPNTHTHTHTHTHARMLPFWSTPLLIHSSGPGRITLNEPFNPPCLPLAPQPSPSLLLPRYFPTILIVLLAVFNDGAMIALSKDRVIPSQTPNRCAWA